MNLLLDTHALLWWVAGDTALTPRARKAIDDEANTVHVSAVSALEVSIKHRRGKLPEAGALTEDFLGEINRQGFVPLSVTLEHGDLAGRLPIEHKDPFDRILIAQALLESMTLISNERVFDSVLPHRLW